MADETDPPEGEEAQDAVAPAAAPEPAAPAVDPGRALGVVHNGGRVPSGTDLPTSEASTPQEGDDDRDLGVPTAPAAIPVQSGMDAAPAKAGRMDRASIALRARAQVDADNKARWDSDYSASKAVPAGGYKATPKQYADATRAAIQTEELSQSQGQAAALATRNAALSQQERQMIESGQEYRRLPDGSLFTPKDPATGRPLYKVSAWEEGVNPDTGEIALTMRDRYGQRQYKAPPLVAGEDITTDNNLYAKLPNGSLKSYGDMDDLLTSKNPVVAIRAHQLVSQRNTAMRKQADSEALHTLNQVQLPYLQAQSQLAALNQQMGLIDPEKDSAQFNSLLEQTQKLSEAIPNLKLAHDKAEAEYKVQKVQLSEAGYTDKFRERQNILKIQGKPEKGDPVLDSINAARTAHQTALAPLQAAAQKIPAPTPLTDEQRIASTGKRLNVGAAVPGKPGVFESAPAGPHANDPVVDPDNPTAPPPPASKLTLSQTLPTPAAPAPSAPTPAAPAAPKIDPALAGEPFALASRGVKNVGDVSIQDMAKRYGSGQGPVQPLSLIKMKNRSDEITATLGNSDTQIDPKLRTSLTQEQNYLNILAARRFQRMTPDQQKQVTEATRDPTWWDKIKGMAKSATEAAATGGAGVVKGLGMLTQIGNPFGPGTVVPEIMAGQGKMAMDEIKGNPLYKAGSFIDEAAKEAYAKNPHEDEGMVSQALNKAAEGAGGFAPLVASGPGAPLTIGLQTVGNDMERIYQEQIAKGAKPDAAAASAVKRAMAGGAVQSALFALLPKPLQKMTNKLIVDRITGSALTKFLSNRLAQATEGATLGGASAATSNLTEGRPITEGLTESMVGLGAMQAAMPRGAHVPEKKAPETPTTPVAPTPAPEPAAPFKPTGEGAPKSAAESAKTLVPEAGKAKADQPPPAKSAEESALAFKAHDELNRRAAAKEESAQKLVDQIQEATGKSRGEILATRAGKDIDAWHAELKKEAAYQKNPLVVDPERRATELRADLKQLDAEWQDHLKKTAQEAEAADAIQKLKDQQPKLSEEEAAKEADRQKKLGVEIPEERTQARHDDITGRREAIEDELATAERLRQSPQGGTKLADDLEGKGEKVPRKDTEPPAKPEAQAEPETAEAKEDPEADRARYDEVHAKMAQLIKDGKADSPEFRELWKENEELKNRNSSDPGMPPEPVLADQKVKLRVKRGNGAEAEIEMPAKEAAKRVNDHIKVLDLIKGCLGGAA